MKRFALILLVVIGVFGSLMANVDWENALAIRQGVNIEWFRTAASMNEGVVYVWSDTRHGERDLYAQLINPSGQKMWGDHGLLVDSKPDRQEDPVIISTSDNGVIIAWVDFSDDADGNIYAQKLNAQGTKLWAEGGVPLCTANKVQISLNIVPDNNGGAIVVWNDYRLSSIGFYAQHINAQGAVSWQNNGIRIGVDGANVSQNTFWEDGQNGAIIAFLAKNNNNITNIYGARILPNGTFAFGPSLITNFTSDSSQPGSVRLAPSSNNQFILGWEQKITGTENDYEIFIQKINLEGAVQFGANGINITNDENVQEKPRLSASTNGDFFVVWEDKRYDNNTNPDIFVQKFNNAGTAVWANPVAGAQMPERQFQARIASLDDGGCVVVWEDERDLNMENGSDIYAQKYSSTGSIVWEANGKPISNLTGNQTGANVKVLNNQLYFIWADQSQGSLALTQQIVNNSNQLLLPVNGSDMFEGLSANASEMKIFTHNGNAFITWLDERYANLGTQIFIQKVDENRNILFAENGISVTENHSKKIEYDALIDNNGNLVIFWLENIDGVEVPKAQKISSNGDRLWGVDGIALAPNSQAKTGIYISVQMIAGDYYFFWNEVNTDNLFIYIKGQKIVGNQIAWGTNGKTILTKAPNPDQFDPENIEIKLKYANQNYLAFLHSGGIYDLYLLKITSEGTVDPAWPAQGVPFASIDGLLENDPQIQLTDQGPLVLWVDNRNMDSEFDIYAQMYNEQGQIQFAENGIPVASYPQAQDQFVSKWDGRLTMAWRDFRDSNNDNYDIYVQRYNYADSALNPAWNANGVGVAHMDSAQTFVDIELMHNRVLAVWEDAYYDHDIHMGMVDHDGTILAQQISITDHIKKQTEPKIGKISNTNAYVAWIDYISSGKEEIKGIYMQKVSTSGFTSADDHIVSNKAFRVYQNYPNPFNPTTAISFSMKAKDRVSVVIYNVKGQKVRELANDIFDQGIHTLTWDGKDKEHKNVSSGIYYYQVKNATHTETKKMLLMK